MATRMGVSRATYENFERGLANLSLHSLLRLLAVLGCEQRFATLIPDSRQTLLDAGGPSAPRRRAKSGQAPLVPRPVERVEVRCQLD
jgi:transcriptional regulator with XRE-family HTH domain